MSPLLLAVALLAAAYYGAGALRAALRTARMFWKARRIPGPREGVLRFAGPLDELLDRAVQAQRQFGNTVRVWAWPAVNVTISDPEDLEVLFNSPHLQNKPAMVYEAMMPILGKGLVTLSGETHRQHRKAISPSLHLEILQSFMPLFEQSALKLCKQLEARAAAGQVFDAVPLLGSCAAQSICATVFSAEWDHEMEAMRDYFIKFLLAGAELMFYRIMRPWYSVDAIFYFSSKYDEYHEASRVFETFVSKVLAHKTRQLERGLLQTEVKRKAFLDHVLTSAEGQVLSRAELIEELKTMSGAGIGTSMDLMSVFLIVVALLPHVQDKIVKELDDVFGGSDRPVEHDDLSHLQYLECVIKETLRLFPPVFTFSRSVLQDVEMPSGHVLPEGCIVATLPYFTHRNPRHFPDPEKFDPDRFLPENSRGRHPYAYIPFSAGARNCIGQRYAMLAARMMAATILRRFRVLPSPDGPQSLQDIKLIAGISVAVKGGCNIIVERRQARSDPSRG